MLLIEALHDTFHLILDLLGNAIRAYQGFVPFKTLSSQISYYNEEASRYSDDLFCA